MSPQPGTTAKRACAPAWAGAHVPWTALALASLVLLGGCAAPRTPPGPAPEAARPTEANASTASTDRPPEAGPEPVQPQASATLPVAAAPAATKLHADAPPPAVLRDGEDVFAALRGQLATQACSDDRVVRRWLSNYARAPSRFAANLERVLPLLAHVVERVRDLDLPGEFALLPIVESWYRPEARNGGTAGLWQFSRATARGNGLRVDDSIDQRYAPGPATDAALAHLSDLQRRFGDWKLAVMAFNAGEYRVSRLLPTDAPAPAPSPEHHQPPGLSLTTYEHLAKLLALACLVREPERIGLDLPKSAFQPLEASTLSAGVVAPAQVDRARMHVVRSGDSLWTIAQRHGTTVKKLLRWNALPADAVLHPGQRVRLHP